MGSHREEDDFWLASQSVEIKWPISQQVTVRLEELEMLITTHPLPPLISPCFARKSRIYLCLPQSEPKSQEPQHRRTSLNTALIGEGLPMQFLKRKATGSLRPVVPIMMYVEKSLNRDRKSVV